MNLDNVINKIKANLNHDLPGWKAQKVMSVHHRVPYQQAPDHAIKAAVLILIHSQAGIPHITYVKRQSHIKQDKHKGQISFPGGRYEYSDRNLWQTALRETEEEIGVASNTITKLGKITPLYIPVSNFIVHPYIGYTTHPTQYRLQISEIEKTIDVPMYYLFDPSRKGTTDVVASGKYRLSNVPYYDLFGEILWGATAMMTSEFTALFQKADNVKTVDPH